MRLLALLSWLAAMLFLPVLSVADEARDPHWKSIEQGFELGSFPIEDASGVPVDVVIARFDPQYFDFVALCATLPGKKIRSLRGWVRKEGLVAAINAGMYQEDGLTHTGYFRFDEHVNNHRIAMRFGAFFVAMPYEGKTLPRAAVLDRSASSWESLLPQYRVVVQNFRLISADRRPQWDILGPEHPVSALGMDTQGRILFIHCREDITCNALARQLLELPVDLVQTMYVEGGSQAGLAIDDGTGIQVWSGRGKADFLLDGVLLPNIIGVRRR